MAHLLHFRFASLATRQMPWDEWVYLSCGHLWWDYSIYLLRLIWKSIWFRIWVALDLCGGARTCFLVSFACTWWEIEHQPGLCMDLCMRGRNAYDANICGYSLRTFWRFLWHIDWHVVFKMFRKFLLMPLFPSKHSRILCKYLLQSFLTVRYWPLKMAGGFHLTCANWLALN